MYENRLKSGRPALAHPEEAELAPSCAAGTGVGVKNENNGLNINVREYDRFRQEQKRILAYG